MSVSSESFACGICLDTVSGAVSASCCAKIFCKECITALSPVSDDDAADAGVAGGSKKCPACRKVGAHFTDNPTVQRLADELPRKCPHCSTECRDQSVLQTHLTSCAEAPTSCFFRFAGCKWTGRRVALESHLAGEHAPACGECHPIVWSTRKNGKATSSERKKCILDLADGSVVDNNDDNDDGGGVIWLCDRCGRKCLQGVEEVWVCKGCKDYGLCISCRANIPVRELMPPVSS